MGYVETQGALAERFVDAMRNRLGCDCGVQLMQQTDFSEPLTRVNTNPIDAEALGGSEGRVWDGIADYHRVRPY
jgi:UDP-glucose 4-epimerase